MIRKIVRTEKELEQEIVNYKSADVLGVDTETTDLSPYLGSIALIQIATLSNSMVINVKDVGLPAIIKHLGPLLMSHQIVKVFHNAKFDMSWIKLHLGVDCERIFDSMIASQLIEGGLTRPKGYHGLAQTVDRYLGKNIDKTEQRSDWGGEITNEMYEYAFEDAEILLPLRERIIETLVKLSLVRVAKLEFEAVLPIVWLELCGFKLDIDAWTLLAKNNIEKSQELATEICQELAPYVEQGNLFGAGDDINLNSPKQVMKYFTMAGIPMPESTKEEFLTPLKNDYPLIEKFIEYKGLAKAGSAFGDSWKEFINPVTGRIHASFLQLQADTGRFACSNPNLQQIPRANEFRNCFVPEEGNVLISADYSQIELRILADLSNDTNAMEMFAAGHCFHTATAAKIFHKDISEIDKKGSERSIAKNTNFAIPYGATAMRVAATAKIPLHEAEIILREYFKALPNIEKWLKNQKKKLYSMPYVRTVSGRLCRFIFDVQDKKSLAAAQRKSTNSPIQGSSADILKRALRLFYDASKEYHDRIKLVNIVHDEINVEAPKEIAENISQILKMSMYNAAREYLPNVAIQIDCDITTKWQK